MKFWEASAPANIAIIKYMGKSDSSQNVGTNPSLSFTLESLRSFVEIEKLNSSEDSWAPLGDGAQISDKAAARYLAFFAKLRDKAGIPAGFRIRSRNNFPADAGIASSASSFAALTKASLLAFCEILQKEAPSPLTLARISRRGSGSSCRSFFGPWCSWDGDEDIRQVPSSLGPLVDFVIAVESGPKAVSSSDAHLRVASSPLFNGRVERARERMQKSLTALEGNDWNALCMVAWQELWDMHSLFHTSVPPFFYFKPGTIAILEWAQALWQKNGTGPLTTIDAGPNVHLLVREADRAKYEPEIRSLAEAIGAKLYISQ